MPNPLTPDVLERLRATVEARDIALKHYPELLTESGKQLADDLAAVLAVVDEMEATNA